MYLLVHASGQGSELPAYLACGMACPARTRRRVISTQKTNPPTWATEASKMTPMIPRR